MRREHISVESASATPNATVGSDVSDLVETEIVVVLLDECPSISLAAPAALAGQALQLPLTASGAIWHSLHGWQKVLRVPTGTVPSGPQPPVKHSVAQK